MTTRYFPSFSLVAGFGGAYEVQFDGTIETTRKYYAFAGMTIAMDDDSGLKYFLTDHLGSMALATRVARTADGGLKPPRLVAVTDASGALVSGTCAENGTLLAGWYFTYDGGGNLLEKTEPSGILSL